MYSQLLPALQSLGHSITALAPVPAAELEAPDAFALANPAINVVRYPVSNLVVDPFEPEVALEFERAEKVVELLPRLIADIRPQLILNGGESDWGISSVAARHSLPHVMVVTGTIFAVTSGSYPACAKRALLQEFDGVTRFIAVAKHQKPLMAGLGFTNVDVIANSVDVARFGPASANDRLRQRLGIPDDAVVVMHPSNMKPVKRPLDVIRSAQCAIPRNERLVYLIVGDGPCLDAMKEATRAFPHEDRILFTGWVEPSQMADYYNLAHIVVMPSQSEGMAAAYLEALACGRTLLASDIPATRELLTDGETGLLFTLGDIDGLTQKTLLAAEDVGLRAKLGAAGRTLVSARHDFRHMVARYADKLDSIAAEWAA